MSGSEVGFLALMRANRPVQNRCKADQAAIDLKATKEFERARPCPRRPDSTDDKINEAFKRALLEDDRMQGLWCYPASALFHVALIPGLPA